MQMDDEIYRIAQPEFKDRYKLGANIANTGLSRVFIAEDKKYSRDVVIKFFAPSAENLNAAGEDEFRQRFDLEARTIAQLNHPNLVQIYDFGVVNRMPFMVFEYIKGSDLRTALRKMRGLVRDEDRDRKEGKPAKQKALEEFLVMFYQICDCIEYVHKNRIIHRDLKPGNVLLQKQGKLVVCDLGLAKVFEKEKKMASAEYSAPKADSSSDVNVNPGFLTAEGSILGTPAYMAPEQVRGEQTDTRTDVYGLGAILYEAVKGMPPFADDGSDFRKRQRQDWHEFDMPAAEPILLDIILLALKKEPEHRYQDVSSLKSDVRSCIEHFLNTEEYIVEKTGTIFKKAEKRLVPKAWLNWSDVARKWARL